MIFQIFPETTMSEVWSCIKMDINQVKTIENLK